MALGFKLAFDAFLQSLANLALHFFHTKKKQILARRQMQIEPLRVVKQSESKVTLFIHMLWHYRENILSNNTYTHIHHNS